MQLAEVTAYGLPRVLIEGWQGRQRGELLPLQVAAIQNGLIGFPGQQASLGNLLISGPTSSGKSFCAELAIARTLLDRRKALVVVPTKSLVEELVERWQTVFAPLNVRCRGLTADHATSAVRQIGRGDFEIVVAVIEKGIRLWRRFPTLFESLGLVVIDELQMLADSARGSELEQLLISLRARHEGPRLLALAGRVSDRSCRQLATWLDAGVVAVDQRPVDLWHGVASPGELRLRSFNTGTEVEEPFGDGDTWEDIREAVVDAMVAAPPPTLVFVKSRAEAVRLAQTLASRLPSRLSETTLHALSGEEPSRLLAQLRQVLSAGVAFHTADLSVTQRRAVEHGFRRGDIRLICATSTLALGVNLPATSVFLEALRYHAGTGNGEPVPVPVPALDLDNMIGRAGRFGLSDQPGRAIVMAANRLDAEGVWEMYFSPTQQPEITSVWASRPVVDRLLAFIVTGCCRTPEDASRLWQHALDPDRESTDSVIAAAARQLVAAGMIRVRPFGETVCWEPTDVGAATVDSIFAVDEAIRLLDRWRQGWPTAPEAWWAEALDTPSWRAPSGWLSSLERRTNLWVRRLYQEFADDAKLSEIAGHLPTTHATVPLAFHEAARIKAILAFREWQQLTSIADLEANFGASLGAFQQLGRDVAHRLRGMAGLMRAARLSDEVASDLENEAFACQMGVPRVYRDLVRRAGDRLGRRDCGALWHAGIRSLDDWRQASLSRRESILGNKQICQDIDKLIQRDVEEDSMAYPSATAIVSAGDDHLSLDIDGSFEGDRFLIKVNGQPVRLTGKSFKYLTKLAHGRVHGDSGWVYKDDLETGFNQARYLYRMKSELAPSGVDAGGLVENNRLGYYRLAVDPNQIRLNRQLLAAHPDWEIRSLFSEESSAVH